MEDFKNIGRKINLIKSSLDGELSEPDSRELQEWLESSEKNKEVFRQIRDKHLIYEKLEFRRNTDPSADWKVICRKTGIFSRKPFYVQMMRYAAVFIGVCAVAWGYMRLKTGNETEIVSATAVIDSIQPGYRQAYIELVSGEKIVLGDSLNRKLKNVAGVILREEREGLVVQGEDSVASDSQRLQYNRIIVPRGGEYQMILADGTKVWLNSDTKLEFPVSFQGQERKVRLEGEAYFEVKRNENMPFRVEVKDMMVEVLGTSFNIHAYDEDVQTTLIEGSVQVNLDDRSYRLHPGEQAGRVNGKVCVEKVDIYEYIAWKEGKFVFCDKRLEDVLEILGRWYDLEIFYQNSKVRDLHFTGNIPRHAAIDNVLKLLERTRLVHFSVRGRTVIVSE